MTSVYWNLYLDTNALDWKFLKGRNILISFPTLSLLRTCSKSTIQQVLSNYLLNHFLKTFIDSVNRVTDFSISSRDESRNAEPHMDVPQGNRSSSIFAIFPYFPRYISREFNWKPSCWDLQCSSMGMLVS